MDNDVRYGDRLYQIRIQRRKSQSQLAEEAGMTVAMIYRMENCLRRIDLESAIKLANALECEVGRLYDLKPLGVRIERIGTSTGSELVDEYDEELREAAIKYMEQVIRRQHELRDHNQGKR